MGSGVEDVPLTSRVTVFAPNEAAMRGYRLNTVDRELVLNYSVQH